jgi:hypothetical protein
MKIPVCSRVRNSLLARPNERFDAKVCELCYN